MSFVLVIVIVVVIVVSTIIVVVVVNVDTVIVIVVVVVIVIVVVVVIVVVIGSDGRLGSSSRAGGDWEQILRHLAGTQKPKASKFIIGLSIVVWYWLLVVDVGCFCCWLFLLFVVYSFLFWMA